MIDYSGVKCPVCGKPFSASDDIVVCPKCGAPYHRSCYSQSGDCIFNDLHEAGKVWTAPENPADEAKGKPCPVCGKMNAEHALFCDRCGQSLTGNPQPPYGYPGYGQNNTNQPNQNGQQNNGIPPFGFPPYGFPMNGDPNQPNTQMPFMIDPMGGVNPTEPIDDVPAGDVAKLVQTNTAYYLPTFLNINRFKKNRFNFCAFLFSGGWLLYRKQYKLGAIITAIIAVLYTASRYISLYNLQTLKTLYQQVGLNMDSYYSLTTDQAMQLLDSFYKLPGGKLFLLFLPSLLFLIQLAIMIVVGVKANKWYCRHCIETIHDIKKNIDNQTDYDVQLQSRGGTNIALAICIFVSFIIMVMLPQFL